MIPGWGLWREGSLHALIRGSNYSADRFQQIGTQERFCDDLLNTQSLRCRTCCGQAGSKLARDRNEGGTRKCRSNVPYTLHPGMFGHVHVDDHEIGGTIESRIARHPDMYAISGLAEPLLQQGACEMVFLVNQYVHGVLISPRGS
jgi:hypothetical protein